jgi:hypothetical protein
VLAAVAAAMVLVLAAGGALWWTRYRLPPIQAVPQDTMPPRSWASGAWLGGDFSPARVAAFGAWRGSPLDTVTTYPAYQTWDELASSDWSVSTFKGFPGRLVYGLPLLPKNPGSGTLQDVAAGAHDDVFAAVADTLAKNDRGDAFVRIGLEANGDWFPWGAGKPANGPEAFRAAYQHVATLLRAKLPKATLVFDIGCGHVMNGQRGRLDSLNVLYPGDDLVDVVGCDHYDAYSTIARTSGQWADAVQPSDAAGLQDVVDFARAHGKRFAVPEWGLTATAKHGGGDNPFFVYEMYRFFSANRDVLAFENYFNEADTYLQSSIWGTVQNPKAAAEYSALW